MPALLARLVPGIDLQAHPRDLSEGQRLGVVLAVQLTARPPVLLLDEPTRGLDYGAKQRLAEILTELAADGRAVWCPPMTSSSWHGGRPGRRDGRR